MAGKKAFQHRRRKEAFLFRVPCVTLRNEAEWVETVEAGWNVLVGCDPDRIRQAALDLPAFSLNPVPLTLTSSPYGDGHAAERIVALMVEQDNVSRRWRK